MHELVSAVRQLRQQIGDSQQAFATRLGLSISAITNYEGGRAPTGKSLSALHSVARQAGKKELAETFWKALHDELGLSEDAGRKINDAASDVASAAAFAKKIEDQIPTEIRKDYSRMRTYLDRAAATLNEVDPYTYLLMARKEGPK
jgi:transcriptional regulator with XRE-family HTH domain